MNRVNIKTQLVQAVAIVAVSTAFGILFDRFFYGKLPGLSFPLYVAGLVGGIIGLAHYFHQKPSKAAWWLMIPLIGFATMVAVRASELLTLMNIAACLLLLLLIAKVAFRRRLTDMRVKDFMSIPFLPLQFLGPARHTFGHIAAKRKVVKFQPRTAQIVKGIALTVPVLVVFLFLFASADLIVQKYVNDLVSIEIDLELTARLVLIVLATLGFIGGYSYLFSATKSDETPPETSLKPLIGKVESTILFVSVNTLFFAFILVQLAYLFGGEANISAQGFTYAEYARKGFFELIAVAVVAFGLLWSAEKYIEKTERGHSTWFKFLSSALVLQVILIMGSAFRRLYLYEQAYGFTTLRLYSHAFTVLLAVIFLILAYKIIRSASDQAFAFSALLAVIVFLAALNAINQDAFIARQNLDRYHDTGKIDAVYLSQLSDDAVPVLVGGYSLLRPDDTKILGAELNRRRLDARSDAARGWQAWNQSRAAADDALAGDASRLQLYPGNRN
ncbi:MAG TPA: DUF4173 domain-containing protein [Candidatus Saccharimonadia bacterium]